MAFSVSEVPNEFGNRELDLDSDCDCDPDCDPDADSDSDTVTSLLDPPVAGSHTVLDPVLSPGELQGRRNHLKSGDFCIADGAVMRKVFIVVSQDAR